MSEICIGEVSQTPLGPIYVAASDRGLVAVDFHDDQETVVRYLQSRQHKGISTYALTSSTLSLPAEVIVSAAIRQIGAYLEGERREFDLPINWSMMTPFQEKALRLTYAIPYGQVTTYGEIARQLGKPTAARAVGRAEATNPMPLVIPCHRVIGSDGGLHGYGGRGGLETKAWLLRLEGSRL